MKDKDIKEEKKTRSKKILDESKEEKPKVKKTRKKKEEKEIILDDANTVVVEKQVGFNFVEVLVIMIITLILGVVIGSFIMYVTKDNKKNVIVKNGVPSEMQEFLDTYNNIINNYYEKVDSDKLIEAGINGMLEYLGDDYSVYMDKEISNEFNEQIEGKYYGIGVEIVLTDNGSRINRVFKDSPAEKIGLKPGDIFLKLDGTDVSKSTPAEIASYIKNSDRKEVEITILRETEEKNYKIALSNVSIQSVEGKIIEKNNKKIGYIDLSIFASNTYSQFEKELKELESKKIDSLIIDVRGNSGGYLTCVTDIASMFMDKTKIVYQLDTKGLVEQIHSSNNEKRNYNIVVLVNGASASASEILAAALQESYGAKVIGTKTFGKGTVQAAYSLKSGATVKYTIQKWLTPKGNWINEKGITPDIEIELDENYFVDPSDENDNQLQKALEELSK